MTVETTAGDPAASSPSDAWLRELPKVELHCHLEGSMSVDTVRALAERHRADTTGIWPTGLPERFSFDGFPDFARQYFFGLSLLTGADDLATAVDDLAATLVAQGVRHAELTSTAYSHLIEGDGRRMAPEAYRDGLDEGRRRAAARGLSIGWVIDIPRDLEPPGSTATVDYVLGPTAPDGVVAVGLGGYEVGFPAEWWSTSFDRARAAGLGSVPHGGETEGPAQVRSAIEDCGATRIGHGVRCLEDPAVVELVREHDVMLEVCPTSNLLLGVVDDLADHPLPRLRAEGLRVCVNTDDPGWFATDLLTELRIASDLGVSAADHVAMQRDAVAASFASDDVRSELLTALDAVTTPG